MQYLSSVSESLKFVMKGIHRKEVAERWNLRLYTHTHIFPLIIYVMHTISNPQNTNGIKNLDHNFNDNEVQRVIMPKKKN